MKIVQAHEDSNILLKRVIKTIKNETKEQKGGSLSMSFITLGASLLGNSLTGKGIVRSGYGNKGCVSIFLCAIVLQIQSPTKCTNSLTCRVESLNGLFQ